MKKLLQTKKGIFVSGMASMLGIMALIYFFIPELFPVSTYGPFARAVVLREAAELFMKTQSCGARDPFCMEKPELRPYINQAAASGAMLTDFDKLIVYMPLGNFNGRPMGFSEEEKRKLSPIVDPERFRDEIRKNIEISFKSCLKKSSGEQKPIIFLSKKDDLSDVYDPKNLTIVLLYNYGLYPVKEGKDYKKDADGNVVELPGGNISGRLYRPHLPANDGLTAAYENSVRVMLEPTDTEDDLKNKMYEAVRVMTPRQCSGGGGMTF